MVDFTGKTLIAILGDTGAGKSTILEAITLGLYGYCIWTDREHGTLMAAGAGQMTVAFTFAHDGQRWRVCRVFHANTTPSSHLLQNLGTGERTGNKKAVKHKIKAPLQLDFDSFTTAVLLPQGKFDRLLTAFVVTQRVHADSAVTGGLGDRHAVLGHGGPGCRMAGAGHGRTSGPAVIGLIYSALQIVALGPARRPAAIPDPLSGPTVLQGDGQDGGGGRRGCSRLITSTERRARTEHEQNAGKEDGYGRLELTKFHMPADQSGNRNEPANTLGIRHVAFAVEDIDAVVSGLRARG